MFSLFYKIFNMGSNLDTNKFQKWIERNHWHWTRTKKHQIYILEVVDESTGETILYDTYTFPFNKAHQIGNVQDYVVGDVAKKMKIKKNDLIKLVREQKDLGDKYISTLKEGNK